jgi:hypothetical protein
VQIGAAHSAVVVARGPSQQNERDQRRFYFALGCDSTAMRRWDPLRTRVAMGPFLFSDLGSSASDSRYWRM